MLRPLIAACALLCAISAAAADFGALAKRSWIKVETRNFVLVTDQPEATGRQVVADLEALRYFKTVFDDSKPLALSKPLPILAIGGHEAFALLGLDKNWAGVFELNLDGYAALANIRDYNGDSSQNEFARAVVLHEYHHFLVRMTEQTLAYPRWLDEGLAEYWATFNAQGSAVRLGQQVAGMGRFYGLLSNSGMAIKIDTKRVFNTVDLPGSGDEEEDGRQAGKFYSAAYFATHYFHSTPALRAELAEYLRMINLGYPQDRAARLAFKRSYEQLDQDIVKYIKYGMGVRELTLKQGKFDFPKVEATVTRLDEAALYANLARIVPLHAFPRKDVAALLARNRELNPGDADANVLPLQFAQADGPVEHDALLKRFPRHPGLLTMRADGLRRQAEQMQQQGAGGWLQVALQSRDVYRQAIAIDPGSPRAYLGLGLVYRLLPDSESLDEAVAALDSAAIYARDPEVFGELAQAYLRMRQPASALQAMRSAVAFNPQAGKDAATLQLDNLELLAALHGAARAEAGGLAYPEGASYTGQVGAGQPSGRGKLALPSGAWYEGDFVRGQPHGRGKLVSSHGKVYEGAFVDGYMRPAD